MLHTRLGQLLLDAGCVTAAQLQEALARQQETRQPLGQILCERQVISEDTLLKFLGQQYGLATAYPFPSDVAPQLANCVPQGLGPATRGRTGESSRPPVDGRPG